MSSMFDPFGVTSRLELPYHDRSDLEALAQDWQAVGDDLRRAMAVTPEERRRSGGDHSTGERKQADA